MQQVNILFNKNSISHLLLLLFFLSFNFKVGAEETSLATLQIHFPDLTNVHTEIRVNDGIAESATGALVKISNWKNDSTTVQVEPGYYDLIVKKGAAKLIIDNVNCDSNICTVNNIVATLTIEFPGLKNIHSSVHVLDNIANSSSGEIVTTHNWQNDQAVITVLRQSYDLSIRKNKETIHIADVDCSSGSCQVEDLTATMTVNFPGLDSVHTSVRQTDNTINQATGNQIFEKNWQNDKAQIIVFKKRYDLHLRKGESELTIDNVDCTSGHCFVDDIITTLTVNFDGLSGVHTSVYNSDNILENISNKKITHKNWQNNQAVITLLQGVYDLKIRKGNDKIIIDGINCSSSSCLVDDLTAQLIIEFPGLDAMTASVFTTDDISSTVSGNKIVRKNGQTDQVILWVFKKHYDIAIQRKNSEPLIKDDVDCTSGQCKIDNLVANMSVKFPGISGVHTLVQNSDDLASKTEGKAFSNKNWQSNETEIIVLRQKYDVSIRRNNSQPVIINGLDCTSGSCEIDNITATLTVKFPKMNNVHTSLFIPDGKLGSTQGAKAFNHNWQKNQAELTVFRQMYDVAVQTKKSESLIVDDVDCTSGSCTVDQITATLIVDFSGMRDVHTSVHAADDIPGIAENKQVTELNWQTNQATLAVFRQKYDINVYRGKSQPMIIEALDCTSGSCQVNNITANLTVDFPGLVNAHTSVHIPDNNSNTAGGREVTNNNWRTDKALLTVFRQHYDVRVKHGSITKIVNDIDCTSGTCNINEITSILSIKFPGLINVHSSAHIPDSVAKTADGHKVARSKWKMHQTQLTLLRETYDVKVNHGEDSIFDNVNCNNASCNVVIQGNVQTVLIDGDSNKPLVDKYILAYEKMPDGTLHKVMKGKTTDQGQINFTLKELNSNRVYVLKTYNPFGNGKSYYSAFITNTGKHEFIITVDGENSLDLTPPTVNISSPQNGRSVTNKGFIVTGIANDNREINRVELSVNDPVQGLNIVSALYNAISNTWTASVPETLITLNNDIILTATAYDQAQSKGTATITATVIEDNNGPEIIITSHSENDLVPVTGFLLSGTVTDLTQASTLNATLVDSVKGETMTNQAINFSINSGSWTLIVDNDFMSIGENGQGNIDISLNATDSIGNPSSINIHLSVAKVDYSHSQMINRITFGATPLLIKEVETLGALEFLEKQLNPGSIDDSELDAMLPGLPTTKEQLQTWTLMHMAFSQRQLQEIMTWFWDNHFNTDINTKRTNSNGIELKNSVQYELDENQAFRANAFGNFGELLEISAKSPAMLIYLDNISNVTGDSNENYSREVKELHTLSVNGGYTDLDVENGAEIFTGWHVQDGVFSFDESEHTVGSYMMFKNTAQQIQIIEGGVIQGEQLLNALATHPSTANFICSKLITLFVNDSPPASLVTRCAEKFLEFSSASDQIERILRLIMQSAEFNDTANYRSKIKTPVEFVIGAIRNLDAESNATDLISPIKAMGIRLYENPVPTGWSEKGVDWINTSSLIERIKWINKFVRNEQGSLNISSSNPIAFYSSNGYETAEGIVGFLLQLTVGDDFTLLARENALNTLGLEFEISDQNSEMQLQKLNGHVMSFPQYQFQ